MAHRLRLALVACTALLALALAGQAFGAYNPQMQIVSSASGVAIGYQQGTDDDATAKIVFYAPLGATTNLTASVGSTIGAAAGVVNLAGATPALAGPVLVADPTNPTIAALSTACTGTAQHGAIWLLRLTLNDQTIELPASVDLTTGAEATFSSAKIQVCFRSPYIPPEQGGQPLGIKPIQAAMTVNGVFSYPSAGDHRWTGIFVPYGVGTGTANPLNAAESQAVVQSPLRLRITGRRVVRTTHRSGPSRRRRKVRRVNDVLGAHHRPDERGRRRARSHAVHAPGGRQASRRRPHERERHVHQADPDQEDNELPGADSGRHQRHAARLRAAHPARAGAEPAVHGRHERRLRPVEQHRQGEEVNGRSAAGPSGPAAAPR